MIDVSPETVVEKVDLPENLSVTIAASLSTAFRTYYLVPRLAHFSSAGYSVSEQAEFGRAEYVWPIETTAPGPSGAPERELLATAHVRIAPDDLTIEFRAPGELDAAAKQSLDDLTEEIRAFVTRFLRIARRSALYLSVPPYARAASGVAPSAGQGSETVRRIFSGNSTNVVLLVILLTLPAVFFLGLYAFVLMIGVQAVVLFYSDRIALGSGFVRPSADRPKATVIGVALTAEAAQGAPRGLKRQLPALRARLSDAVAAAESSGSSPAAAVRDALGEAGVRCSERDIEITTRDVYRLVQDAAGKFRLPVPNVIVTDQPVSNAAATGVAPGRASMTITAGSLEELSDGQLEAVIGHELGHIRGRDPVILFGVNSVLYLGAVFLWLPLFLYLGLGYIVIAFVIIYLVGKVLETRADTFSAMMLGRPEDLASALTVSAFEEAYAERRSRLFRLFSWLSLDSHPPIYFRVKRLLGMAHRSRVVRYPTLTSVRDCAVGFLGALAGKE